MIHFFNDIKKYWRYMLYSARAQLKNEVAGSFLNWLWWILNPLLFMLVYTFVYSIVFQKHQDYLCSFIFLGNASWSFFNRCVNQSVRLIKRYQSVLSKVYLPKYILILSTMMVQAFKMGIDFCLVFLTMAIYRVPLTWNFLWFIPYLLLLFLFTFGISCVLMHCGVYLDDLANIVNVLLRLLFYFSGIFYNPEVQLAGHPLQMYVLIRMNPTCFIITSLRNCMLYGQTPLLNWYGAWVVIGLLISVLGVSLIYKYERRYVKSV